MQMRNWLQCPSSLTHGNIIKREILSKKGSNNPDKDGAILGYADSFSRCYLEPRIASIPMAFDDRQLVFYIVDGEGVFEGGNLKREVSEGDCIIVPPGLTHVLTNEVLTNEANALLEFLLLEEIIPEGVEAPRKDALIRNYRENHLTQGHWTHLVHSIFSRDDGLVKLYSILVVRIEAMQTPDASRLHAQCATTNE